MKKVSVKELSTYKIVHLQRVDFTNKTLYWYCIVIFDVVYVLASCLEDQTSYAL